MTRDYGFTIVEVCVVLAIISISILLWAQATNYMDRSIKNPEAQVNLGAVSTVVRETLKYSKTCQAALTGGINSTGFTFSQMTATNAATPIKIRIPGILGDANPADDILEPTARLQHLEINAINLVNVIQLPTGNFFGDVEISASSAVTGLQLRPVVAGGVWFTTTGSAIATCETADDDPTTLCEEMGCTWDPLQPTPCTCTPIDLSCPPQQFITGVDNLGQPICTPLGSGPCAPGEYLQGVSIGVNNCVPISTVSP